MGIGNFFAELKRRHVYRAGGAYAIAAFGLIEIVSNVTPMLDLPAWLGRALILILIVGFPLTLFTAWMIEGKPAEGAQTPSISKLDYVLAGALVLVAGLLVYQQVSPARDTALLQKAAATATPAEGVSIAVLPFVNLSSDKEQEFFSDGMTEEITSALARVKGLRVVGRTSAFEFKGQNKDLRAIGQALGAANLLEGSVRKVGNRVRITGQLIRAADGSHIWTENYDRELTDIFATQDDIARAIASALQAPLGLKAGESLVTSRAVSSDNYQQYLAAKAIVRGRGFGKFGSELTAAIRLLEAVVVDDPAFAPAFALLGYTYALVPGPGKLIPAGVPDNSRRIIKEYLDKAQAAGSKAIQLDPKHVGGYLTLAYAEAARGRWAAAEDLFKQALALDPNDPDVLHEYSVVLSGVGKVTAALEMRERLLASDPLVTAYKINGGAQLRLAGRPADSIRLLEEVPPGIGNRNSQLAQSYAAVGRFSEAADLLLTIDGVRPQDPEQAANLLRTAPKRLENAGTLPPLYVLGFVYLYVGAPERALDYAERAVEVGYVILAPRILEPEYSVLRKTERFKTILRKSGLVDYWRARGWPDMCHPIGTDDFECN